VNTDDFIAALSADAALKGPSLPRRLAFALALGAVVSLILFVAAIGPRADAAHAMRTMRYDLKFLDTLALLAPSFFLCLGLARPQTTPGALLGWLLAPIAVLAAGVAVELATVPQDEWMAKLIGANALHCLTVVPLFSLPPLAALIWALREGAPSYPALTGALAGAASAGVAATLYASNCPDDSPLFVATWYPLATAFVMALGALAGRAWLRW
jgi:hypothetical protein